MIRPAWARVVLAGAALALSDCALGDFCTMGASGCVDPGCHDGKKDGDESDVDCGGSCAPCGVALGCAAPSDCASGRCVGGACCAPPCGVWASSFGSILNDLVTGVAASPDGSMVYLVGLFNGIVDFGTGPITSAGGADVFVLALDASGAPRWSLRFGGPGDEVTARLTLSAAGHPVIALSSPSPMLDLGGGPLASHGAANLYAVELDTAGNHVWSRAYPTATQVLPGGLATAPNGDLILAGSFGDIDLGSAGTLVALGGASYNLLVARLDPTGAPLWGRGFGEVYNDYANGVAIDANGDIYVAATYSNSFSFGDGGKLPFTGGVYGMAVAKLDGRQGNGLWSSGYPGVQTPHGDRMNAIAVDDRGRVWLAGSYGPPISFVKGSTLPPGIFESAFVVSLDAASGTPVWARGYGGHTMEAQAVIPDGQGGVVIAGLYKGNADFGGGVALVNGLSQLFVARLDAGGQPLWARNEDAVMTTPAFDTGIGGALLAPGPGTGRITVAGGFRGTLDIGTGPHTSVGMTDAPDAFVAVLVQ